MSIIQVPALGMEHVPVQRVIEFFQEQIKLDDNKILQSLNSYLKDINSYLKIKRKDGRKLNSEELVKYAWTGISIYSFPNKILDLKIREKNIQGFEKIITSHPYKVKDPFTPIFQKANETSISRLEELSFVSPKTIVKDEDIRGNKKLLNKILPKLLKNSKDLENNQYSPKTHFEFISYRLALSLFNIKYQEEKFSKLEERTSEKYGNFVLPIIKIN